MSNSTIIKNSFFLLSRTIIVLLVSLFTVRELLAVLGVEHFGLFSLIFGVAVLFSFVNGALVVSIQRYLGIKIGENNNKGLVGVFFTSCIINMTLGSSVCLVMLLMKDFVLYKILNISSGSVLSEILYFLAIINTFLIFLQTPFIALINIYERMNVLAYVGIIEVVLKLICVYLLFLTPNSMLVSYAMFFTTITFISFLIYLIYSIFNFKIFLNFKFFSINEFKKNLYSISGFMGWTLIGNFAWVSKNQGVNILLNMFFGLVANAAYAVFNNFYNSISSLLNSITNAIKPQIFISYSKGDITRFNALIINGTKFFNLGMVIFTIPIIIFSDKILLFWLNEIPKYVNDFVKLGMVLLLIESMSIFLTIGVQAVGKIKVYQMVLGVILLSNIPIIFMLFSMGYPINIYMYVLIINALIGFLARLLFLRKYVEFNIFGFLKVSVYKKISFFILIFFINRFLYEILKNMNLEIHWLILFFPFFIVLNIFIAYFLGINKQDKLDIKANVNKILVRK